MGFYIQGPNKGKAKFIIKEYKGKEVSQAAAGLLIDSPSVGVICVVENAFFDAAGFMFSAQEYLDFTEVDDFRPKRFVVISREKAEELSGFSS